MNPTIVRRIQVVLLTIGFTITVAAIVLVAGCLHNDAEINASKATVMAEVVSADHLHADVNFQTPDGTFYSPRLGLLYPTELTVGQRISVEYASNNPDLARPAGRTWTLAIVPAISVAVAGWLVVGVLMVGIAEGSRRWSRWTTSRSGPTGDGPARDVSYVDGSDRDDSGGDGPGAESGDVEGGDGKFTATDAAARGLAQLATIARESPETSRA